MKYVLFLFSFLSVTLLMNGCGGNNSTDNPAGNQAPSAPSSPSPTDGAVDQATALTLSWQCSDPDGDTLAFDVYFGTTQNPPLADSNCSLFSYPVNALVQNTTYYWKVVAKDGHGHEATGGPWNFSTAVVAGGLHFVGHYDASDARKVRVDGDYAFVLLGSGFLIINVSNPSNPIYAGNCGTSGRDFSVSDGYAYFIRYDGLSIVDVSNPQHPQPLYPYMEDVHIYDGRDILNSGTHASVTVYDSILSFNYEPSWGSTGRISRTGGEWFPGAKLIRYLPGVHFCAVSGASRPASLCVSPGGQWHCYEDNALWPAEELFSDTNFAYVACLSYGLQIIDISNQAAPAFAGGYIAADQVYGAAAEGNYAFIAAQSAGLIALDISNPANPIWADSYETSGPAYDVVINENYIFVAAGTGGLYILEFVP